MTSERAAQRWIKASRFNADSTAWKAECAKLPRKKKKKKKPSFVYVFISLSRRIVLPTSEYHRAPFRRVRFGLLTPLSLFGDGNIHGHMREHNPSHASSFLFVKGIAIFWYVCVCSASSGCSLCSPRKVMLSQLWIAWRIFPIFVVASFKTRASLSLLSSHREVVELLPRPSGDEARLRRSCAGDEGTKVCSRGKPCDGKNEQSLRGEKRS